MDVFLDRISHSYFQKETFESILFDNTATNKNSMKSLMQMGSKEKTPISSYSKGQRQSINDVPTQGRAPTE